MIISGQNSVPFAYNFPRCEPTISKKPRNEDPIVTITKFLDKSTGIKALQIQVYSYNDVVLSLEGNQEVALDSNFLDLPELYDEALIEYLKQSFIVLSQFDDMTYKMTSKLGLPAGAPKSPLTVSKVAAAYQTLLTTELPRSHRAQLEQQIVQNLLEVSKEGDWPEVKLWLEVGADINSTDSDGCSPLHHAASLGRADIIEDFISKGANIDAIDKKGLTPFAYAINSHEFEAADMLFSKGARKIGDKSIVSSQTDINNLLCNCCRFGKLEIVKIAIDTGANINGANPKGNSCLLIAAAAGFVDIVEYLAENGATIDAVNSNGKTPLTVACECNKIGCIKALRQRGADPTKILASVYKGLSKNIKDLL